MARAANYVFARLTGTQILALAEVYRNWVKSQGDRFKSPVYRVWEDTEIHPCLTRSLATIKGDACHRAFNSFGEGIVWAVLDSGIDKTHLHFAPDAIDVTLSQTFVGRLRNRGQVRARHARRGHHRRRLEGRSQAGRRGH